MLSQALGALALEIKYLDDTIFFPSMSFNVFMGIVYIEIFQNVMNTFHSDTVDS